VEFRNAQVILFVADCERAAAFYETIGFTETFRVPRDAPIKVEMALGGFELGLALPGPAATSHHISPVTEGHRACITVWTDDCDAAYRAALAAGAVDNLAPHPFLGDKLRIAMVEDPDGHPVQLVQRVATEVLAEGGAPSRP
jgi:uncharacterized glyoxalase superfamily protein PhnB